MTRHQAERTLAVVALAAIAGLVPGLLALPRESAGFPLAILAVMGAMAIVLLLRGLREAGDGSPFFLSAPRFVLAAAIVLAYTALLPRLGFFTASALLGLGFPPLFGYRNWRMIVPTVAIFLVLIWLVFVRLFQRPLPAEFFLG